MLIVEFCTCVCLGWKGYMPRLRELNDGSFIIRTGFVKDDEEFYGTWQVHGMGVDFLNARGIYNDGDEVSIETFIEMRDARLVWSETGGVRRRF